MSLRHAVDRGLERRDAGFVVGWLLAVVLLVPVQIGSLIVFDELGFDILVPYSVFMAVVPAVVLAAFLTLFTLRLYNRRTAWKVGTAGLGLFGLAAAYTMQFYGFCGPGC